MKLTEKQLEQLTPILASAFVMASGSKSRRRSCAALIVRWRKGIPTVVSSGLNGMPVGASNNCETPDLSATLPEVVHAEINAVAGCLIPPMGSSVLVCTDSPCPTCLEFLKKNTGINTIVYGRYYRETKHLAGMDMYRIPLTAIMSSIETGVARMDQVLVNAPDEPPRILGEAEPVRMTPNMTQENVDKNVVEFHMDVRTYDYRNLPEKE